MYLQVTFLSGIKNRNLIVFTGQYYALRRVRENVQDFVLFLLLRKDNAIQLRVNRVDP